MPKQTFFRLRREKQARIEHAAMEEFTNYSFQDSNVNRIIKGAEIPPGSFYQYFEDKKDLFFYLLEKEMVLWEKGLANQRIQAMYRDVETMKNNHRLMQDYMRPEGLRLFKMLSLAPDWVRRDWVFSVLITRHRGNLYSLAAPPEAAEGNPLLARHEDFFCGVFLEPHGSSGDLYPHRGEHSKLLWPFDLDFLERAEPSVYGGVLFDESNGGYLPQTRCGTAALIASAVDRRGAIACQGDTKRAKRDVRVDVPFLSNYVKSRGMRR